MTLSGKAAAFLLALALSAAAVAAQQTQAQMDARIATLLADNVTGDITAADVRAVATAITDSAALRTGVLTDGEAVIVSGGGRLTSTRQLPDSVIPAGVARDSELPSANSLVSLDQRTKLARIPSSACTAGQILKWGTTAFACDADASGSGGLNAAGVDARIATWARANSPTGTIPDATIPALAASKITSGAFDAARIPNLNASKISAGTLAAARIPGLAGEKITSGVVAANRIDNALTRDAEIPAVLFAGASGWATATAGECLRRAAGTGQTMRTSFEWSDCPSGGGGSLTNRPVGITTFPPSEITITNATLRGGCLASRNDVSATTTALTAAQAGGQGVFIRVGLQFHGTAAAIYQAQFHFTKTGSATAGWNASTNDEWITWQYLASAQNAVASGFHNLYFTEYDEGATAGDTYTFTIDFCTNATSGTVVARQGDGQIEIIPIH